MTTKYITTTYADGYTLKPAYSALDIEASGTIDGGLTLTGGGAVSVTDNGLVAGAYFGPGKMGGAGLSLAGTASLAGTGVIIGGKGGDAYYGAYGGVGVSLATGASLTMTAGTVTGGVGGVSTAKYYGFYSGGGQGVRVASGATLTAAGGTITGGAGGYGARVGGDGGMGVYVTAGGSLTTTGATKITGGAGGGDGGYGGAGIVAEYNTSLSISGTITGGQGGEQGAAGRNQGGAGGIGVVISPQSTGVTTRGSIRGGAGGYSQSGSAGLGGTGVDVNDSSLTNAGTITGGAGGYSKSGAGGTGGNGVGMNGGSGPTVVTNFGTILGGAGGASHSGASGAAGDGVNLQFAGASVINGDATHRRALISGLIGVHDYGATVINFATIQGTGGTAVALTYGGRLVVEAGAVFIGAVNGGGGGTLELAGGGGTITGLGSSGTLSGSEAMTFSGFGSYVIDAGETWLLAGSHTLSASQTLANAGTLIGTLGLGGASDRVILETGGVFGSPVQGSGGALELAAATGTITGLGATGTVSGAGAMTFSGFGSYLIDAGGSWTLAGTDVLAAGQTLANGGTLIGTLGLGASDRVVVETGGVFDNVVNGGGGTLEMAAAAGTISGLGATGTLSGAEAMTFSGFGTLDFDAGTSWTVTGKNTLAGSLTNAGSLIVADKASLAITGAVDNNGVLEAEGHLELKGAVSGSGTALIDGGTLSLDRAFTQGVTFGTAGELQLSKATAFTGSVTGFSKKGKTALDLSEIGFVSSREATFSGNSGGGVLTVTDGTHTAKVSLVGKYTTTTFTASSDGHGGTIVTAAAAPQPPASPHAFVAAMAQLTASVGDGLYLGEAPPLRAANLGAPHVQMA